MKPSTKQGTNQRWSKHIKQRKLQLGHLWHLHLQGIALIRSKYPTTWTHPISSSYHRPSFQALPDDLANSSWHQKTCRSAPTGINMKIDSFKWSCWWSNFRQLDEPQKNRSTYSHAFLSHQKNPQGFFWVEKTFIILCLPKNKNWKRKKSCVLKISRLFSWSPRGGSGFWAGSICISAWQVRPYIQGKWGPYLGGSSAPSKWFFVTMGFLCPKLGFCTPKSTSSDSKYLEDDHSCLSVVIPHGDRCCLRIGCGKWPLMTS